MASKPESPTTKEKTFQVRSGTPLLEAGYTPVPNLLLDHYETLGLTEGTALFVIRLLRHGLSDRKALPDSPHLETLRDRGLLFVQQWPDRVELRLDPLFHNLARLADWLADGRSPADFKLEVPAEMLASSQSATARFDSPDFDAEVNDVIAAFAAANRRTASPAEKEQIRHLAVRFDAAARAAAEPSNGPAWVMAALRSTLEKKPEGGISVSDLEQAMEERMAAASNAEPAAQASKATRRKVAARIRKMSPREKEALGTVVMAYQGVARQPPDDRLVLVLMQLSDTYGPTWVLNAIHETGKVQQLISPEYIESILMRWRSEGRIPNATAATESPPLTDTLLAHVVTMYEQEVGSLTPQARDQLLSLTKEFRDVDEWRQAFAEAARSNARNLRYVEAVLRKKGKNSTPAARRSTRSRRRPKAARQGVWTKEELDAARQEALSLPPVDVESLLGEDA